MIQKNLKPIVDDTEFDNPSRYETSNKTLDEVNEDLAHAIFEAGLLKGKTYEEVLEYVKRT